MENIKQKKYPLLEVDCREKDIVQVWMNGKDDSNVIQVERGNLQALIDILKREADSFKNLNKAHVIGSLPCEHRYSRSINQPYPRKCVKCGEVEKANLL